MVSFTSVKNHPFKKHDKVYHDFTVKELSEIYSELEEKKEAQEDEYSLIILDDLADSLKNHDIQVLMNKYFIKSLVISGDAWEFNHPKRVLTNIVELLLTNVNKEMIVRKLSPILPSLNLNALRVLRLINTNIQNLVEVYLHEIYRSFKI